LKIGPLVSLTSLVSGRVRFAQKLLGMTANRNRPVNCMRLYLEVTITQCKMLYITSSLVLLKKYRVLIMANGVWTQAISRLRNVFHLVNTYVNVVNGEQYWIFTWV